MTKGLYNLYQKRHVKDLYKEIYPYSCLNRRQHGKPHTGLFCSLFLKRDTLAVRRLRSLQLFSY